MDFKNMATFKILEYINGCIRVKNNINLKHFNSAVKEVGSRSKLLALPYK